MIPELGNFALALATCLALAQAIMGIWGATRRDARMMAATPGLALGQFLALAAASAALVWAAVSNDFSVVNIAENSSTLKPLLYKITGTWGNHEGSILLWGLILGLCGAAVSIFGGNLPTALRARVLGVLGGTSCGFLLFALTTSNPFLRTWPPLDDGSGMNPLLQDPGLAFHPPILYTGYVGFAVPFAFAVAALLEGRIDAAWGRWVRPWALVSWCFLTCGIALGSWWAYYELGWGGFWFWDPVENASLMPWLTGTALVHSAIVVEKRESLKIWTVLLAIGTFSFSLSGTFLVRSGILNSVHSFANDPARGIFILALLALLIGGSLTMFALRAPKLSSGGLFAPISREGALILNNIFLCTICAVVVVGTMFPPFADLLFGAKISVGAPFFNATVMPLALPLFAAMAVGPLLPWKRARLLPVLQHAWWAGVIALAVFGFCAIGMKMLPALAFGLSAWIILGSFAEVVERTLLFRAPVASSVRRARGLPASVLGGALAHAGVGVTIAGLAGASLSTQTIVSAHPGKVATAKLTVGSETRQVAVNTTPGQTVHAGYYDMTLDSLTDGNGPNYTARIATITLSHNGQPVMTLTPSRRTFPLQHQTTYDVAIRTNFLWDIYAVLGDERDGEAVLRLHVNILAPWIWLGAGIMAFGGGISLADRRFRVGAPARARLAVTA
jgi:cytochrome c-type biogenesis protein CcmF